MKKCIWCKTTKDLGTIRVYPPRMEGEVTSMWGKSYHMCIKCIRKNVVRYQDE